MNNNTTQLPNIFTRQPDAQFDAMQSLLDHAKNDMETSSEKAVDTFNLDFQQTADGLIGLSSSDLGDTTFPFTHYSMMQACRMAKLGTDVVERLQNFGRTDLAVDNLNTLFPNQRGDLKIMLLDGQARIRALNGADYSRLWDYTIFNEVNKSLIPNGFIPAVAKNGCGSLLGSGRTALFRGDQTSFGFFFTSQDQAVDELGGLRQGLMIWNSEVGARSFGFSTFYFREQSGTFLIWDKKDEKRRRFVHRGNIARGFREYMQVIRDTVNNATNERDADMQTFNEAANTPFAATREEAMEKLNKMFDMNKQQAEAVINASFLPQNASGPELSVWRISLGIAYEAAQTSRAESMVDDSMTATKVIRRMVK